MRSIGYNNILKTSRRYPWFHDVSCSSATSLLKMITDAESALALYKTCLHLRNSLCFFSKVSYPVHDVDMAASFGWPPGTI